MGIKLFHYFFSCIRDIQRCRLHRGGGAGVVAAGARAWMVAADWGEGVVVGLYTPQ